MKLLQKGLIFISCAFLAQTGVFAGFSFLLHHSEQQRQQLEASRSTVTALLDMEHRLNAASVTLILLAASRQKTELRQHFADLCAQIPDTASELDKNSLLSGEQRTH